MTKKKQNGNITVKDRGEAEAKDIGDGIRRTSCVENTTCK